LTQNPAASIIPPENTEKFEEHMLPLGMNMGEVIFEENKESSSLNNNTGSQDKNNSYT
jgi:hypothetical protein